MGSGYGPISTSAVSGQPSGLGCTRIKRWPLTGSHGNDLLDNSWAVPHALPSGEPAQRDIGGPCVGGSPSGHPNTVRCPGGKRGRNVWPYPAQQGKAVQYIRDEDNPMNKYSKNRLLDIRQRLIRLDEGTQPLISTVSGHAGQPRGSAPQRRPKPIDTTTRERNTNRGLRSIDKINERKTNRTIKRAIARRLKRLQKSRGEAPAQEASLLNTYKTKATFLRFNIRNEYKIANLNIRGAKFAHKQLEAQAWMAKKTTFP